MLQSNLSIVPVRSEPSDKAETVTQILFGEIYEIVEEQKKWVQVRLAFDSYQGWIDRKQIGDETSNERSGYVTAPFKNVNTKSGNIIVSIGSEQEGQLSEKQDLIQTAFKYLNTPYLWGGKSIFGIDCSGFTQQVFKLSGINLPRDAYQQVELGEEISFEDSTEKDLAFFTTNNRTTHVGIILEGNKIIHASGKVRVDQLTKEGIINSDTKELTHTLSSIKRIAN